jgi:mannose-6-phosphate isomerase-like protein (cupin superfamily)
MRNVVVSVVVVVAAFVLGRVSAQDVEPSCAGCAVTHIPADEIGRYAALGSAQGLVDQQVRSIDIGRSRVQIAMAYRGALDEPGPRSVASHDLVTEVYVVLSGSGTNRTGPDLVDPMRRPPDHRAVQFLNGPGNNSTDIRDAQTHELQAGDVFVIPAGTGHQFSKIDDHISYLMVRIDPDKVVPLMDQTASEAYLAAQTRP